MIRGAVILGVIWLVVWLVGGYFDRQKATAEKVADLIEEAEFADWSEQKGSVAEGERRKKELKELAEVWNRLNLDERQKLREVKEHDAFLRSLAKDELAYFADLTFVEGMRRIIESFDQMDPETRKQSVKRLLKDIESGRDADEFEDLKEEYPELMEKMVKSGLRTYYDEASAETKMDMAPLLEALSHMMQGFSRGNR